MINFWTVEPRYCQNHVNCILVIYASLLPCEEPSAATIVQYIPRNMHTVLLCFALLWLCNRSHEVFIHIHQGCFAGTGAIVRLPQCQWSKPDGYGKFSQCITTTKHSKAKTVSIFLGIYCISCEVCYIWFTLQPRFIDYFMLILLYTLWNVNVQDLLLKN